MRSGLALEGPWRVQKVGDQTRPPIKAHGIPTGRVAAGALGFDHRQRGRGFGVAPELDVGQRQADAGADMALVHREGISEEPPRGGQAARFDFCPSRMVSASRSQSRRPQRSGSSRVTIRSGSGSCARSSS